MAGKFCIARGRLPRDYLPLINQSERAYYLNHIIKTFNDRGELTMFEARAVYFLLDKSTSETSLHAPASHLLLESNRITQGKN